MPAVPTDLDHILLGINDLDLGIAWMEARCGVRAAFGGVHPGRGTRNALLSLGPRRYLEIIAPDPQQSGSGSGHEIADALRAIEQPRLVGWAVHSDDLAALAQRATESGIAIEGPRDGSRARPDGKVLRWKSFSLKQDYADLLPFFIEWGRDSMHPSQDAPPGCKLESFFIEAETAKDIEQVTHKLSLDVQIKPGKTSALRARITGKNGAFELT